MGGRLETLRDRRRPAQLLLALALLESMLFRRGKSAGEDPTRVTEVRTEKASCSKRERTLRSTFTANEGQGDRETGAAAMRRLHVPDQ